MKELAKEFIAKKKLIEYQWNLLLNQFYNENVRVFLLLLKKNLLDGILDHIMD